MIQEDHGVMVYGYATDIRSYHDDGRKKTKDLFGLKR